MVAAGRRHRDGCYNQVQFKSVPLPIRHLPQNTLECIQVTQREADSFTEFPTLLPWALTLGTDAGHIKWGSVMCDLKINHALMDGQYMRLFARYVP